PPPVRVCCRGIAKTFGTHMAARESQPAPLDVEEFGLQRRVRSRFCFALGFSRALVAFPNLLAQWLEHDTPPTTEHSRPIQLGAPVHIRTQCRVCGSSNCGSEEDLAEMAVSAGSWESAPLAPVHCTPKASPFASSPNCPADR